MTGPLWALAGCPVLPALAASALLLGVAAGAAAESAAWVGSKAFGRCVETAGGNDPRMTDCAREEFSRADTALNVAYAERLRASGGKLKETLRTSQRAWIAYRDATCQAEGAVYEGGTMEPLASVTCRARLTDERSAWLKTLTP